MTCDVRNPNLMCLALALGLAITLFNALPAFSWESKDPALADEYARMIGFKVIWKR